MESIEVSCPHSRNRYFIYYPSMKFLFVIKKCFQNHLYLYYKSQARAEPYFEKSPGVISGRYPTHVTCGLNYWAKELNLHCFGLVTVEKNWLMLLCRRRMDKMLFEHWRFFLNVSAEGLHLYLASRPVSWPSNYFIWNSTEGTIKLEVVSRLLYHKLKLLVWWGESRGRVFITAQVTACQ